MTLTTNRYLQTNVYTYTGSSTCSICFDDTYSYNQNDPLFCHRTSCGHLFHTSCINRWYMNSTTCPCCRQQDTTVQHPLTDSSFNNPYINTQHLTNNEINNFIDNNINIILNNILNNNNANYIINNNIVDNNFITLYIINNNRLDNRLINNINNNNHNNDNMILA